MTATPPHDARKGRHYYIRMHRPTKPSYIVVTPLAGVMGWDDPPASDPWGVKRQQSSRQPGRLLDPDVYRMGSAAVALGNQPARVEGMQRLKGRWAQQSHEPSQQRVSNGPKVGLVRLKQLVRILRGLVVVLEGSSTQLQVVFIVLRNLLNAHALAQCATHLKVFQSLLLAHRTVNELIGPFSHLDDHEQDIAIGFGRNGTPTLLFEGRMQPPDLSGDTPLLFSRTKGDFFVILR